MSCFENICTILTKLEDISVAIKLYKQTANETSDQLHKVDSLKNSKVRIQLVKNLNFKLEETQNGLKKAQADFSIVQHELYHLCASLQSRNLSEDSIKLLIESIYEHKFLSLCKIQLALFSSSFDSLATFSNCESNFIHDQLYSDRLISLDSLSRFFFVECVLNKKHFLDFFYSKLFEGKPVTQLSFVKSFVFLVNLEQWSVSDCKWQSCTVLEDALIHHSHYSDKMLTFIAKQKIQNIMITKLCLQNYSLTKANHLLNLLNHHTVLYAIQASLPFYKLPYQKVISLLSSPFLNNQNSKLNADCIATYQAYYCINLTFQIISRGIEMDREVHVVQSKRSKVLYKLKQTSSEEMYEHYLIKLTDYYSRIESKWKKIKEILNSLTSLELRLEVLENLYSLLFLRHSHICDEMDESIIDEGERASPDPKVFDGSDEFTAKSISLHSLSTNFKRQLKQTTSIYYPAEQVNDTLLTLNPDLCFPVCSSTPIQDLIDQDFMSSISETYSGNSSTPTLKLVTSLNSDISSSSSICDFSRCGYLVNQLVAWDLLLLLRDALVTLQADTFGQLSKKEKVVKTEGQISQDFTQRRNSLTTTVTEALWRIHIIMPFQREFGSTSEIGRYFEGKLTSMVSSTVSYQNAISEEVKDKTNHLSRKLIEKRIMSHISSSLSFTDFLLSKPTDLFCLALINNNLPQARQVLIKYELLGGPEEQELVLLEKLIKYIPLLEEYSNLRSKLEKHRKNAESKAGVKKVRSILKDDNPNVAISAITSEILTLSTSECQPLYVSSIHSLMMLEPKMILIDIALTSHLTEENAVKLFTTANMEDAVRNNLDEASKATFMHGIKKCQEFMAIYHHFDKMKDYKEKSLFEFLVPARLNPQHILLSDIPLDSKVLGSQYDSWFLLVQSLSSCEKEAFKLSSKDSFVNSSSLDIQYRDLLKVVDRQTCCSLPQASTQEKFKHIPYSTAFYSYIKLLNTVLKKNTNFFGNEPSDCYFDLLTSRPVSVLGSVMFHDFVSPIQLEELSSRMKIDLLSLILQFTLPPILFSSSLASISKNNYDELFSLGCCQWGDVWILNGGSLLCSSPSKGSIIARDILGSLLDTLKDVLSLHKVSESIIISNATSSIALRHSQIKHLLKETCELASSDLNKLDPGDETLSFFVNLGNLLYLHTSLLNSLLFSCEKNDCGIFSSSELEKTLAFRKVGYLVGTLGFVSLWELLYLIIKLPLNNSLSELLMLNEMESNVKFEVEKGFIANLMPSVPSKLIFCISQAGSLSPRMQVFYCDSFEEECNAALVYYVTNFVAHEFPMDEKCPITHILWNYLTSHPHGWDCGLEELLLLVSGDSHSYLQKLKGVKGNPDFVYFVQETQKLLTLECFEQETFSSPSGSINHSQSSERPKWKYIDIPVNVQEYLKSKCPLLNTLVEEFTIFYKAQGILQENDFSLLLSDKTGFPSYLPLIKIFTLSWANTISQFEKCREKAFVAILEYLPQLSTLLAQLEAIYSCPTDSKAHKDLEAFNLLDSVPSVFFNDHPLMENLKDQLTIRLAGQTLTDILKPWIYVYKNNGSPLSAFQVVKNFHKLWPMKEVVQVLHWLSCDHRLPSKNQAWAEKRMRQILNFNEILNLSSMNFVSWQEVDEISKDHPSQILKSLISQCLFSLGVAWLDFNPLPDDIIFLGYQCRLLNSLDKSIPDFDEATSNLKDLETFDLIKAIQGLLDRITVPSTRKFLIEFFLSKPRGIIPESIQSPLMPYFCEFDLRQELIGLLIYEKAYSELIDGFQLLAIIKNPYLIVEQLLMNLRLDFLRKVFPIILPHLKLVECKDKLGTPSLIEKIGDECLCLGHLNSLIEKYASKALEMSGIEVSLKESICADPPSHFTMPQHIPQKVHWQQDSSVRKCPVCDVTVFSIFFRRHHCRRCGRVVCSECSQNRLFIAGYQDVPVRVCRHCYFTLTNESSKDNVPLQKDSQSPSQDNSDDAESPLENAWYLSVDSQHNACVRKEFTYNLTPSLNLCQSLMSLHQDERLAAVCMCKLSLKLFSSIVQSFGFDYSELDTHFLLQMIQSLISFAKLKFLKSSFYDGISLCEYLDQWMTFLKLISKSNCLNLISKDCLLNVLNIGENWICSDNSAVNIQQLQLQDFKFLRTLRDRLVEHEKWDLALDISTKVGLEVSGVWGARGMAFLKAGEFLPAREYFAKSLSKIVDKNVSHHSYLLKEIVNFLESKPFLSHVQTSSSPIEIPSSTSCIVLQALDSLSSISNGLLNKEFEFNSNVSLLSNPTFSLSPILQNECEYYLKSYGCHRTHLRFLIRHNRMTESLKYVQKNNVGMAIFNEEILLPTLKKGEFNELLSFMKTMDRDANWYPSIIFSSCQWVESSQNLHCLVQIQECLQDRIRAAVTLIRLYVRSADSYASLANCRHYLTRASKHLKDYLNDIPLHLAPRNEGFPSKMQSPVWSRWKVNQQLNFIEFQIDASRFLSLCELNNMTSLKPLISSIRTRVSSSLDATRNHFRVPTVFRGPDRLVLAITCICAGLKLEKGLNLVYQLIEINSIEIKELLKYVPLILLELQRSQDIHPLVKNISEWGLLTQDEIKESFKPVILHAGKTCSQQIFDDLIVFVKDDADKIEAYIAAGKLRSAYILIAQRGKLSEVKRLQDEAKKLNNSNVFSLCTKWIRAYEKRQR